MSLIPTMWEVLAFLITSLLSVIFTIIIQYRLPPAARERLIYFAKSWRKSDQNSRVTVSSTAKYTLPQPRELEEFSNTLSSEITKLVENKSRIQRKDQKPSYDKIEVTVATKKENLNLSLDLHPVPRGTRSGGQDMDKAAPLVVESLSVTAKIRTEYSSLRWALEMCTDFAGKLSERTEIPLEKKSTYNVKCELSTPTVISDFLAKLEVDRLKAEANGLEIYFDGEEVLVRNLESADSPDVFDKIEDLVIYYG